MAVVLGSPSQRTGGLQSLKVSRRAALDPKDGVQHPLHLGSQANQLGAQGVDQEGHVWLRDFDDGVLGGVAVLVEGGVEETQDWCRTPTL